MAYGDFENFLRGRTYNKDKISSFNGLNFLKIIAGTNAA